MQAGCLSRYRFRHSQPPLPCYGVFRHRTSYPAVLSQSSVGDHGCVCEFPTCPHRPGWVGQDQRCTRGRSLAGSRSGPRRDCRECERRCLDNVRTAVLTPSAGHGRPSAPWPAQKASAGPAVHPLRGTLSQSFQRPSRARTENGIPVVIRSAVSCTFVFHASPNAARNRTVGATSRWVH